jgi:hypothetical protein
MASLQAMSVSYNRPQILRIIVQRLRINNPSTIIVHTYHFQCPKFGRLFFNHNTLFFSNVQGNLYMVYRLENFLRSTDFNRDGWGVVT